MDLESLDASTPQLGTRVQVVLTRWRALAIVTAAYGLAAWGAAKLFGFVESQQGIDDGRDVQVTTAFAVIMGVFWLVSVIRILFHPRFDGAAVLRNAGLKTDPKDPSRAPGEAAKSSGEG